MVVELWKPITSRQKPFPENMYTRTQTLFFFFFSFSIPVLLHKLIRLLRNSESLSIRQCLKQVGDIKLIELVKIILPWPFSNLKAFYTAVIELGGIWYEPRQRLASTVSLLLDFQFVCVNSLDQLSLFNKPHASSFILFHAKFTSFTRMSHASREFTVREKSGL